MTVTIGTPAPDFTLASDTGEPVTLSALSGRTVVLYFYPRDDTPGCTRQACGLRDAWTEVAATGTVVFGVSPDSVERHARFRAKYALPFALLADTERTVATAYGVWAEKMSYGRRLMGIERSSFVIGPDGVVAHVFRRVKPDRHAEQILAALREE
ncbi:MAG: thioredoxin-dependent thiol peroxidase [Thermoleophilia bacterium]|nr:thioredoxin-dependent thiol peroxidase [Thermoleophilia bacterium]